MTTLNNPDYYQRRAAQERALADRAVDRSIADIHRDLAERYAELEQQATPRVYPIALGRTT